MPIQIIKPGPKLLAKMRLSIMLVALANILGGLLIAIPIATDSVRFDPLVGCPPGRGESHPSGRRAALNAQNNPSCGPAPSGRASTKCSYRISRRARKRGMSRAMPPPPWLAWQALARSLIGR